MNLIQAIKEMPGNTLAELRDRGYVVWMGRIKNLEGKFKELKVTGEEKISPVTFANGRIVLRINEK